MHILMDLFLRYTLNFKILFCNIIKISQPNKNEDIFRFKLIILKKREENKLLYDTLEN